MNTAFILIGPRAGFTGELAGHKFIKGITMVPSADADKHKLVLSRYYDAHPAHEFVRVNGEMKHYSEIGSEPAPVVPVAQVPVEPNTESFGTDDLDESLPAGLTE